jgi:hypothetical protein
MSDQARRRELADALAAVLHQEAGAERYQRSQKQMRRASTDAVDPARPLEFDESGFPIAQSSPSFTARVARLLASH